MWQHRLLSSRSIFCCQITKLLPPGYVVKKGEPAKAGSPFYFSVSLEEKLGWEERAPTEDSIGTAVISAGL